MKPRKRFQRHTLLDKLTCITGSYECFSDFSFLPNTQFCLVTRQSAGLGVVSGRRLIILAAKYASFVMSDFKTTN